MEAQSFTGQSEISTYFPTCGTSFIHGVGFRVWTISRYRPYSTVVTACLVAEKARPESRTTALEKKQGGTMGPTYQNRLVALSRRTAAGVTPYLVPKAQVRRLSLGLGLGRGRWKVRTRRAYTSNCKRPPGQPPYSDSEALSLAVAMANAAHLPRS